MELKAITYCYTQDTIPTQKVVGIFRPEELKGALDTIRNCFGADMKIKRDVYNESCDNHFIEFESDNDTYIYTSNYVVGELYL